MLNTASKFSNAFLRLCILMSLLIAGYATARIYLSSGHLSTTFYYLCIASGFLSAALFWLATISLSPNTKINLSIIIITIGLMLYSFETYLVVQQRPSQSEASKVAKKLGMPFDTRTKFQVIEDLRKSGLKAYPNFASMTLPNTKYGQIVTIGSISNVTTILDNESGYYPIITTDEYGFNNPKGLYESPMIDVLLIGDSFAEGYSVHYEESISALLRESGWNTINLGRHGAGPLVEYASLIEYGARQKPRIVLWLYHTNDLKDMVDESRSHILTNYLTNDNFSQKLMEKQNEIDRNLIKYQKAIQPRTQLVTLITLANLRSLLKVQPSLQTWQTSKLEEVGLVNHTISSPELRNCSSGDHYACLQEFEHVLSKADNMISSWEGELYFVYLPDITHLSVEDADIFRTPLLLAATESGIPIIDIQSAVFNSHPDPLSLFPLGLRGHYTAEGYRLVTEAILSNINLDVANAN